MTARRRVIFIFLDGVGLGVDDPEVNPLAVDLYPTVAHIVGGRRLVKPTGRWSGPEAELIPVDAQMGIPGRPQSATGQAAILTGVNAPECLGEHYGPRPDARVRAIIETGGIFRRLRAAGRDAYFCNAYPERYFDAVNRGKRLLSAVPYAALIGGQKLLTHRDILSGNALAADFTNQAWRDELGYVDAPVYAPVDAGREFWRISENHDFTFFEHWQTDVLGHRQALTEARIVLRNFDAFLTGLLDAADLANTLIIVASDHGNIEDCRHGKHTENPALALLLGEPRHRYASSVHSLVDFVPVVLDYLQVTGELPSGRSAEQRAAPQPTR